MRPGLRVHPLVSAESLVLGDHVVAAGDPVQGDAQVQHQLQHSQPVRPVCPVVAQEEEAHGAAEL